MPKRRHLLRSLHKRPKELTILPLTVFSSGLLIHLPPAQAVAAGLGTAGVIAGGIVLRSWRRQNRSL
ncbi:hypothetical protein [Deinococcus sedimenti]|uniref:Uncharacterized protein n=1 Tax=Deinococcus sedimenti TaxID=1867090 RepID=A0ABQ2S7J4_9DEIO|nr:hypothetical protein [Deinococcus sedimenti]GGR93766.1 hypothetical protein GCM10008960_20960 [Deinococcus sedimenti]